MSKADLVQYDYNKMMMRDLEYKNKLSAHGPVTPMLSLDPRTLRYYDRDGNGVMECSYDILALYDTRNKSFIVDQDNHMDTEDDQEINIYLCRYINAYEYIDQKKFNDYIMYLGLHDVNWYLIAEYIDTDTSI